MIQLEKQSEGAAGCGGGGQKGDETESVCHLEDVFMLNQQPRSRRRFRDAD